MVKIAPFCESVRNIMCLSHSVLQLLAAKRRRDAQKSQRGRRWQVRPINRSREQHGAFRAIFNKILSCEGEEDVIRYTRLNLDCFNELLQQLRPHLKSGDMKGFHTRKDFISVAEKLLVTLRFLATGNSFQSIAYEFRLGKSTVLYAVREMCEAIWTALSEVYLKLPSSPEEWNRISEGFERKWQFPHCVGAIDGKHCHVKCPSKSGSLFFNYKKSFSIILLAACDSNYQVLFLNSRTCRVDFAVFMTTVMQIWPPTVPRPIN